MSLAPSADEVEARVLPALFALLEEDANPELARAALLALGRAGADGELAAQDRLTELALARLSDHNHAVLEAAVVALGLSGDFRAVERLSHLVHGCDDAREALGGREPNQRLRALAACAMGLAGARSEVSDVRRYVVRHIALTLDAERDVQRELRVACISALGLNPLPVAGIDYAEARAGLRQGGSCLEQQLAYLVWYLQEDGFDAVTRAHVPTALARLARGLDPEWKAELVDVLREQLSASGSPRELRQSCALALGVLADADGDAADERARKALLGAVEEADLSTRHFALMAIAQAAGRPGQGKEPLAGTADARRFLVRQLARGKSTARPWAALALGVLGHELRAAGAPLDPEVDAALRAALADCGNPERVGAYAIALGLRGDLEAREELERQLERFAGDELAAGELAVALGLIGARESRERLWELTRDARRRPHTLAQAAIGLALAGDQRVGAQLVEWLAEADALALQSALADALGFVGDRHALEGLAAQLAADGASQLARARFANALGRVADRDELPWGTPLSVGVNYCAETEALTSAFGTGLLSWD